MLKYNTIHSHSRFSKRREFSGRIVSSMNDKDIINKLSELIDNKSICLYLILNYHKPDNMRSCERFFGIFNGTWTRINPRMFQNTLGAKPLMSFLYQQASDQIFRVFRNTPPLVVRELIPALLNTCK